MRVIISAVIILFCILLLNIIFPLLNGTYIEMAVGILVAIMGGFIINQLYNKFLKR